MMHHHFIPRSAKWSNNIKAQLLSFPLNTQSQWFIHEGGGGSEYTCAKSDDAGRIVVEVSVVFMDLDGRKLTQEQMQDLTPGIMHGPIAMLRSIGVLRKTCERVSHDMFSEGAWYSQPLQSFESETGVTRWGVMYQTGDGGIETNYGTYNGTYYQTSPTTTPVLQGQGTLRRRDDGLLMRGNFVDNELHDPNAIIIYPDGSREVGPVCMGYRDGEFTVYDKDIKERYKRVYKDDYLFMTTNTHTHPHTEA